MRTLQKAEWSRRIVPVIGILVFAAIGTFLLRDLFAAPGSGGASTGSGLTFSLFATHPYASKAGYNSTSTNYYTGQKLCSTSFCPVGQALLDMEVTETGELIAGYGDWNSNSDSFGVPEGRVGIVPLNLETKVWGPITPTGSEANDVIRKIGGKIYAPATDPSDPGGSRSGYVTNESGSWVKKDDNMTGIHTFDVATLNGTDRWVTGSGHAGVGVPATGAVAWRSTTNNGTWAAQKSVGGDWARYYWAATINNTLYIDGYTSPVMMSFDGTTWKDYGSSPCNVSEAKKVVVFENKIVCPGSTTSTINTFDGNRTVSSTFSGTSAYVADFYVHSTGLYILDTAGNVYQYTSLGSAPQLIGKGDISPMSIAVHNGYVYLGYDKGIISRSTQVIGSIPSTPIISANSTSPNTMVLDKTRKQVTISGTSLPAGMQVRIGGVASTVVSATPDQVIVSVDTAAIIKKLRLRNTATTRILQVELSSSGYGNATAPSITATYTP